MSPAPWPGQAALLVGTVRHTRLRPVRHAFSYPTFCVMLPMRSWAASTAPASQTSHPALARNRWAWMSFHDRDHGDGGSDALAWLQQLLGSHGVHDADGEIWLQTYPRVLGFVFKPVSFWYCHRADGRLRAIVAEVNNTFGERHCYLLESADLEWGRTLSAEKVFHVSPFFPVRGHYHFRFMRREAQPPHGGRDDDGSAAPVRPAHLVARIEYGDAQGPLLLTSVGGALLPLNAANACAVLLRMPLLTLGVVARIHWQALQLWLKRVPFFRKPAPPAQAVSAQVLRSAPVQSAASTPIDHLQPQERPV